MRESTRRARFQSAVAAAALLAWVSGASADIVSFDGAVARGEAFVHRFAHDGAAYEFRLAPVSHGWQIWVSDPAQPDLNFVAVATPPFRGINPARIEGWHFRNADNSGPNEPGDKNVNAPQMEVVGQFENLFYRSWPCFLALSSSLAACLNAPKSTRGMSGFLPSNNSSIVKI